MMKLVMIAVLVLSCLFVHVAAQPAPNHRVRTFFEDLMTGKPTGLPFLFSPNSMAILRSILGPVLGGKNHRVRTFFEDLMTGKPTGLPFLFGPNTMAIMRSMAGPMLGRAAP